VSAWLDPSGRLFNPNPTVSVVPLTRDQHCVVIDDALAHPEALLEWAASSAFEQAHGNAYPGLVLEAPAAVSECVGDYFAQHVRKRLGARRTLSVDVRLSMVTTPPARLAPCQWQCHRDRVAADPHATVFAASVLYLFRDPALGGTSFYAPRQSAAQTDRIVADSLVFDAAEFGARYGLQAGYMAGSNAYFEQIARVPAAWNRAIFYDGGLFHSADLQLPASLDPDPTRGRLTLNGFFHCKRNAR
jgi:hypothetical protein